MSDAHFRALAKSAAARYPAADRYAVHFAKGKLTGDPVFAHLLDRALVPAGARVLDLGCGQGLVASLLAVAGIDVKRMHGIDQRRRDIARARAANPDAHWVEGDIRTTEFPAADVVVILDVLHYLSPPEQLAVLQRVRGSLRGGGTLLLRVADANGSLRFRYTLFVDRMVTALHGGHWPRLNARPLAEWRRVLESLGFQVQAHPMSEGTWFANALCVARYDGPAAPPGT